MRDRRRGLDIGEALARLDPALSGSEVRELGEGFDNIAYAVGHVAGQRLLLRVSKLGSETERRQAVERDAALLSLAGRYSSLRTNEVLAADPAQGLLLLTLVEGRSADVLGPGDLGAFARTMAVFLTRLHTVPPVEAALTLRPGAPPTQWLAATAVGYVQGRALLPAADQQLVEDFLAGPVPETPRRLVFCHNDLGEEHLVVDEATRAVTGVIDWSDAVLDDPARDVAVLWLDFGADVAAGVLAAYEGPADRQLRDRAWWYAMRAGVEGLVWRSRNRPATVDQCRRRLIGVLRSR